VTTLDLVSHGRFEFGIGASWLEADWEAMGLDFSTRGRRVDESIGVCQRLWSEEVIEHHGECYDFGPVMFEPKPSHAPWPASTSAAMDPPPCAGPLWLATGGSR
jgi:alkanesulfonate monooxygenase SsuD/methylene tetrahydromethanopterin reductase-like flavin-dependent oxidoreductase (luciferase family)